VARTKDGSREYLDGISQCIDDLRDTLWPLNKFIHDSPELAFEEYKAHDALTKFMGSQEGWQVTASAYGIETAWIACYDSGKPGPVVSFNAEYGMYLPAPRQSSVAKKLRRTSKPRSCVRSQSDRHSITCCRSRNG
jgi:hypothetical protein